MRYESNLKCPDMAGFKLLDPPIQNCGHDIPSDPDFEPGCGFWERDELAILYASFRGALAGKTVVEIGSRFGWTAKAIHAATGGYVICVDPILVFGSPERIRFTENLGDFAACMMPCSKTSDKFFCNANICAPTPKYSGFVIDGNHDAPEPLNDAKGAFSLAPQDCMIAFHDGRGKPIQDAVCWLMDQGFSARFYCTPNGVFICWRGFEGWLPPDHDPDPNLVAMGIGTGVALGMPDHWERLS